MVSESRSRSPGPDGPGKVSTTVTGSGAVARIGLPLMLSAPATALFDLASKAACSEKSTSPDVSGAPSDHVRPARRCSVYVRPSALDSQRSASQGSRSKVARFTRTSRPCIRSPMSSAVSSRAMMGLNDVGSAWMEATTWPPRDAMAGALPGADVDLPDRQTSQAPATTMTVMTRPIKRDFTLCMCGQFLPDRPTSWPNQDSCANPA